MYPNIIKTNHFKKLKNKNQDLNPEKQPEIKDKDEQYEKKVEEIKEKNIKKEKEEE